MKMNANKLKHLFIYLIDIHWIKFFLDSRKSPIIALGLAGVVELVNFAFWSSLV